MSFSRLLQNAPYYSPTAFTPSRKRQQQQQQHPDSSHNALAIGGPLQRRRVSRPLVDPYATLTAREFDAFVDDVSTRIRDALTYEPNRDKRIRRGYADDEEYWDRTGGPPGQFLQGHPDLLDGLQATTSAVSAEVDNGDGKNEEASDALLPEMDVQTMLDGLTAQMPGQAQQQQHQQQQQIGDLSNIMVDNLDSFDQALQSLVPAPLPMSHFTDPADTGTAQHTHQQHPEFASSREDQLYPTLDDLQSLVDIPAHFTFNGVNELQAPASNLYPTLSGPQHASASSIPYQEGVTEQYLSIDDLLETANQDAEDVNEAIEGIQQAEELQDKLEADLFASLTTDQVQAHPDGSMDGAAAGDTEEIAVSLEDLNDQAVGDQGEVEDPDEAEQLDLHMEEEEQNEEEDEEDDVDDEEDEEDEEEEEEEEYLSEDVAPSPHVNTITQVRSKEASAVIEIDSSSDEEEEAEGSEIDEVEDDGSDEAEDQMSEVAVEDQEEAGLDPGVAGGLMAPATVHRGTSSSEPLELSASEDEEEEEEGGGGGEDGEGVAEVEAETEANGVLETEEEEDGGDDEEQEETTPPPIVSLSGQGLFSRQLFGELDAPVATDQDFSVSQRVMRHMDEDDIELSGIGSTSGSRRVGHADDDSADEWQALRNIARRRQHQQDEQDVADRYFDDEDEAEDAAEDEDDDDDDIEEEEDEDEDEQAGSDEGGSSSEGFSQGHSEDRPGRASAQEFEDELDDDAVAEDQRASELAQATLEQRVPVPSFMILDQETGEYDVKVACSSEGDEETAQSSGMEQDQIVGQSTETAGAPPLDIERINQEASATPADKLVDADDDSIELLGASTASKADNDPIQQESTKEEITSVETAGATLLQPSTSTPMKISIDPVLLAFEAGRNEPVSEASQVAVETVEDQAVRFPTAEGDTVTTAAEGKVSKVAKEVRATTPKPEGQESEVHKRRQRTPSRRSVTPAREPRKSVEPQIIAAMAVSPENFALKRKSVVEAVPTDMPASDEAAREQDPDAKEQLGSSSIRPSEASSGGLVQTAEPTESDSNKVDLGCIPSSRQTSVNAKEAEASEILPALSEQMTSSGIHEDHHFEPPPPELQSSAHTTRHAQSPPAEGIDLTTDEMETHSAVDEENASLSVSRQVGNDYHHVPPPIEQLQESEAHARGTPITPDALTSVDFTTDEMEAHSSDGREETDPTEVTGAFTEDHHHEAPPPSLTDPSKDEVTPVTNNPLTSVDFTTDEMESHSADGHEKPESVAPASVFTEDHHHEPPPPQLMASETLNEDATEPLVGVDITTDEMEQYSPEPSTPSVPATVLESAAEHAAIAASDATPMLASPSSEAKPKAADTPTRAFNAIQPGLWDPSTPIRFGGRSLEAAVREAYYDPERSATLRKSLGTEDEVKPSDRAFSLGAADAQRNEPTTEQAKDDAKSQESNTGKSTSPGKHVNFISLEVGDEDKSDGAAAAPSPQKDEDVKLAEVSGETAGLPDTISSPGLKQEDGTLTQAVQDGDFIANVVTDALAEDASLPTVEADIPEASATRPSEIISPMGKAKLPDQETLVFLQDSSNEESVDSDDDSSDDGFFTSLIRPLVSQAPSKASEAGAASTGASKGKGKAKEASESPEQEATSSHQSSDEEVSSDDEDSDAVQVTSKRVRSRSRRPMTPERDGAGRNIVTTVIVPGSPIAPSTPTDEMEVSAMLAPSPAKPRVHRHGGRQGGGHRRRPSSSSRSNASRNSSEPSTGTTAAQVHPHAGSPTHPGSSPIQTRSQCTYHKLLIPNPYFGSLNTPGRRMSTRLARAAGETSSSVTSDLPSSYIFLVPGCVTADRKDKMEEGDIVDLGVASVEEEGSAMALAANEDSEHGLRVEGLPDQVLQSLIRVVGIDMFREGDCELLSPKLPGSSGSGVASASQDRKRRRESELLSPNSGAASSKRANLGR